MNEKHSSPSISMGLRCGELGGKAVMSPCTIGPLSVCHQHKAVWGDTKRLEKWNNGYGMNRSCWFFPTWNIQI